MEQTAETGAQPKVKKVFKREQLRKRQAPRPIQRQNDIYITTKTNFKAQQKQCQNLLDSGIKEIYIHCMGKAINRGLNLALHLINNSYNTLTYEINTSTVPLIDEMHPLCDDDDLTLQHRNNSALHIKIQRTSVFGIDI